jgi:hypothetical protein
MYSFEAARRPRKSNHWSAWLAAQRARYWHVQRREEQGFIEESNRTMYQLKTRLPKLTP